jgi:hypothetical protein
LEFPHPARLGLIATCVWLASFALASLATRLGATRLAATAGGIIWALTLSLGGGVAVRIGMPLTLLGGLAVGALIVMLMTRLAGTFAIEFPVVVLACVLGFGPIGPLVGDVVDQRSQIELESPQSDFATSLDDRPDIYLIVADGFVGTDGAREVFGEATPAWAEELGTRGFDVPESGWASYPVTIASIPSLFDMDYPIEPGVDGDRAVIAALMSKLGGDNRLVSTLNDNGYHTVMIEAGWSWSHCGAAYDECVASTFLDEGTFAVTSRSVIGPMVNEDAAHPFTESATHTMNWLLQDARADSTGPEPRFVFGHIMAPHPPFFLTSDCTVRYERDRAGGRLDNGFTDVSHRKDLYREQAACVTDFMVEMASATDPDDVVVFVSDHGSDAHDQLLKPGLEWTTDDSLERLSALVAVRAEGCAIEDTAVIPNLMRTVLGCLAGESGTAEPVDVRMFKGTLRLNGLPTHLEELERVEVVSIMSTDLAS